MDGQQRAHLQGSTPLNNLDDSLSTTNNDHDDDGGQVQPGSSTSAGRRVPHTSRACERCKTKKSRCDGVASGCKTCIQLAVECVYTAVLDKRRTLPTTDALKKDIRDHENALIHLLRTLSQGISDNQRLREAKDSSGSFWSNGAQTHATAQGLYNLTSSSGIGGGLSQTAFMPFTPSQPVASTSQTGSNSPTAQFAAFPGDDSGIGLYDQSIFAIPPSVQWQGMATSLNQTALGFEAIPSSSELSNDIVNTVVFGTSPMDPSRAGSLPLVDHHPSFSREHQK